MDPKIIFPFGGHLLQRNCRTLRSFQHHFQDLGRDPVDAVEHDAVEDEEGPYHTTMNNTTIIIDH